MPVIEWRVSLPEGKEPATRCSGPARHTSIGGATATTHPLADAVRQPRGRTSSACDSVSVRVPYMYGMPRATATGLSVDAIVDAALELIETDGFEALTMRRLADRLGVGAMTLYGYVRTKEDLLAALADRFLDEVELPAAGTPWQERIAEVFGSVRRVFVEHPELAQIVATQPIDGVAAYRGAEVVFAALDEAGLDDAGKVAAFETLTSFTAGFTLREAARAQRGAPSSERLRWLERLPAEEFTQVVGLAGRLAERDSEQQFEAGLRFVIGGIAST